MNVCSDIFLLCYSVIQSFVIQSRETKNEETNEKRNKLTRVQ